ncbi:MAG: 1-deoxy-D-xylulose-5-phosphate synthase, partial [Frankia sp.]|nr:1-deoxy-D-xylulose-5-phosphate synthase [Frankia sp.]
RVGGVCSAVDQALRDAGVTTRVLGFGIEQQFLAHGKRDAILAAQGLTPDAVASRLLAEVARVEPSLEPDLAD